MAELPVINDVFRVAIEWVGGTINPVNVLHFESPDTDDVAVIATKLGTTWDPLSAPPFKAMADVYTAESVLITPLDGHTAGVNSALGTAFGGNSSGEQILNCAAVMSWHTTQRGPRGRGRTYVGPITESQQQNGLLLNTTAADMVTAWTEWHAALTAATPKLYHVVASYTHSDAHRIVGLRCDSLVGSMRRRLDQRR